MLAKPKKAPIDGSRLKNTSDHAKLCEILFNFAEKCLMYDVQSLFEINRRKFGESGCDRNKLIQKSICLDRHSLKSLVAGRASTKALGVKNVDSKFNSEFCGERTLRRRIQNRDRHYSDRNDQLQTFFLLA